MGATLHELERVHGKDLATEDYWAQARLSILRDWVDSTHPESVLDIGCGSGYLSEALARDDRRVVGLDIDPDSIAVARSRETSAEFVVGDALELTKSVRPGTIDTAVLADVIEHFEDPVPALEQAEQAVKPDGRVVVSVPAHPWLYGPHDENQGHARRYTTMRLGEHARAAGLVPIRRRYTNVFPLPAYAFFQKVIRRDVPESARGGQSSKLVSMAKKGLLWAERKLLLPFGVTLIAEFTPERSGVRESVLMTNYEYPPACGGGGVFTRDLRSSLRKRGREVELVAGRSRSALRPNGVLDLMTYPFASALQLGRAIRKTEPDVINGHFSVPSSLLLPVFKRRYGVPYVVNVMGADIHDPTRYDKLRPFLDIVNYRFILKHADAIVVPSRDMAARLPKRFHDRLEVIPYYVDTNRFTPPTAGEVFGGQWSPRTHLPVRLLTVARLVPRKNLETALGIITHLREFDIPATYTVVGDGSQWDALTRMATDLNVGDRVRFTGYVADDDLPDIYREHDIFLLPSHHEAFGIAILEAMASGLPVVTSDRGGQTDIVTPDVGATIRPSNTTAGAAAISTIQSDYERYALNARKRVEQQFSEDAVVARYSELFAEVADE